MIEAAKEGNSEMCRRLIKAGAEVNQRNLAEETALHCAVSAESIPTIRVLLEMGADIDARNNYFETPIMTAISAAFTDSAELVIELLKGKPDLTLQEKNFGGTVLGRAIECDMHEVASILRAAGASLNNSELDEEFDTEEFETELTAGARVSVSLQEWVDPVNSEDHAIAEELSNRPWR